MDCNREAIRGQMSRLSSSALLKVRPHKYFGKISRRLRAAPELLRPWRGAAYRVTTLDYPRPQSILQGQGSYLYGGRWNAMGSFRAVYGSTEDTVAVVESRATADYAQVPWPFPTPRLLVAIELALQAVVDLTDPATLAALDLTVEELRTEDWRKIQEEGKESLTQAVGRAVFTNGGEGLLTASARVPSGVNVAYFPECRREASRVEVLDAGKLERVRMA